MTREESIQNWPAGLLPLGLAHMRPPYAHKQKLNWPLASLLLPLLSEYRSDVGGIYMRRVVQAVTVYGMGYWACNLILNVVGIAEKNKQESTYESTCSSVYALRAPERFVRFSAL